MYLVFKGKMLHCSELLAQRVENLCCGGYTSTPNVRHRTGTRHARAFVRVFALSCQSLTEAKDTIEP
jgi:hypothetical protein